MHWGRVGPVVEEGRGHDGEGCEAQAARRCADVPKKVFRRKFVHPIPSVLQGAA
jgi:hypothetical protein